VKELIRKIAAVLMGCLSFVSLFLGFYKNSWGVADDRSFLDFQRADGENFILGRIVESRQKGIFSDGALVGRGPIDSYAAFCDRVPFPSYVTYNSQIGAQGIVFSVLDRWTPFLSAHQKAALFWMIASALSAAMLSFIVVWFYQEHGFTTALFVLGSALLSSWLTMFGRTMWWSLWAFYLPMVAMIGVLRAGWRSPWKVFWLALSAVFIKCLFNGYEYITTALVMMTVPIFYYGVISRWDCRRWLSYLAAAAVGGCLAVLLSFVILCFQIAAVQGHFADGISHIVNSFAKRSHGDAARTDAAWAVSLKAKTSDVVRTYLRGSFCRIKWLSAITYSHLIGIFFAATWIICFCEARARNGKSWRQSGALLVATWISLCAPLSWFIIFKAHSQIHTHLNFIVWQMPFTLFGFAVCGLVVSRLLRKIREFAA